MAAGKAIEEVTRRAIGPAGSCQARRIGPLIASSLFLACALGGASAQSPIQLHDATSQTGVTFRHTDGGSGMRYIMEAMSAGLATFDYDGDGLIDLYFLNGAPLKGTKVDGPPPKNALYRNLGSFRFEEVTDKAGVGDTGHGLGVAVGDYDNDGNPDLYVNNFGPNVLYHNNGDGTFREVTRAAGVDHGNKVGAGVCFLDVDGDGDLDLYVGNYVKFSYQTHVLHWLKGQPVYPSPLDHTPETGNLFRNNGDGTFRDVSRESGIGLHAGTNMGVVCADYDNDGDTDIYVGNDVMPNFLFQNDGRGHFEEVGVLSGVAYDAMGSPQGSMGTDFGDYDNDGWLDLFVTAYGNEMPALYHNLGNGLFEDVARETGVGAPTFPHVKWGHGWVDFDNDGHRDLYIACGDLDDNVQLRKDTTSYRLPNILLRNAGNGRFVDVSRQSGDGMAVRASSRGVAFDDLDNDGDVDVIVLNSRDKPTILRNMLYERGGKNHWLHVRLRGVKSNRDGVGARVRLVAGDLVQIDEVHSGRGFQSHWGSRLYFGLGSRDRIDRVEVRWPGGGTDAVEDVKVDRLLTITEGHPPATPRPSRADALVR